MLSHQSVVRQVRDRVERFARTVWSGLETVHDADVDRLIRTVVPVVEGGKRTVATLTDAYLAAVATELLGTPVHPSGVDLAKVAGAATRGVPPEEVYRRPAVTVWTALAAGTTFAAAKDQGLNRLLSLAATDLQLAKTGTAREVLSRDGRATGFQRILTGAENCPLCVLASTQTYGKEDLLPIHPRCDCDVGPLYDDQDFGQIVSADDLDDLNNSAAEFIGTDSIDRSDHRRVAVREHGEYGATLSWRDQKFTGPRAV